ncbi:hypothetical protein VNO78_16477 [Psophocarpus tetragonolobus]|uniref:Uncharacterized protein n=1 Tax=Psophocarpus tetragonolobus TaxID=3891 RepID=A0AAN9XKP7_PSOTE
MSLKRGKWCVNAKKGDWDEKNTWKKISNMEVVEVVKGGHEDSEGRRVISRNGQEEKLEFVNGEQVHEGLKYSSCLLHDHTIPFRFEPVAQLLPSNQSTQEI